MSDDNELPRLNLRGDADQDDTSSRSVDHGVSEVDALLANVQSQPESGPASRSARTPKRSVAIPKAGSELRRRGRRKSTDLAEAWSSRDIDDHVEEDLKSNASAFDRRVLSSGINSVRQALPKKVKALKKQANHTAKKSNKASQQAARIVSPSNVSSMDIVQKPTLSQGVAKRRSKSRRKRSFSFQPILKRLKGAASYLSIVRLVPRKVIVVAGLVLVCGVLLSTITGGGTSDSAGTTNNAVAGAVDSLTETTESASDSSGGAEIVSETDFDLLFPRGDDGDSLEIALVSPPANPPVYAYLDSFQGVELRVSQQQIPDEIKADIANKLAEVAADFQATDIIQVDNLRVYSGFTERFGGVQSIIFVKQDVMVFISSAQKLSDDAWAGYITALR